MRDLRRDVLVFYAFGATIVELLRDPAKFLDPTAEGSRLSDTRSANVHDTTDPVCVAESGFRNEQRA